MQVYVAKSVNDADWSPGSDDSLATEGIWTNADGGRYGPEPELSEVPKTED